MWRRVLLLDPLLYVEIHLLLVDCCIRRVHTMLLPQGARAARGWRMGGQLKGLAHERAEGRRRARAREGCGSTRSGARAAAEADEAVQSRAEIGHCGIRARRRGRGGACDCEVHARACAEAKREAEAEARQAEARQAEARMAEARKAEALAEARQSGGAGGRAAGRRRRGRRGAGPLLKWAIVPCNARRARGAARAHVLEVADVCMRSEGVRRRLRQEGDSRRGASDANRTRVSHQSAAQPTRQHTHLGRHERGVRRLEVDRSGERDARAQHQSERQDKAIRELHGDLQSL